MKLHNPQIDPIFKKGTQKIAVLLLHGFTGTPDAMRYQANYLHELGFTVSAPLLEGHGTTPDDLSRTTWQDWLYSATQALNELKKDYQNICVAGLSLGALLSLKLVIDNPEDFKAIACLATPLHLQKWAETLIPVANFPPINLVWKFQKKWKVDIKDPIAKRNFWNYDKMPISCIESIVDLQKKINNSLHKIEIPTLLIHSRHDSTAPYSSMFEVAQKISSEITEMVTLENSYHVITVDYDKNIVAEKIGDFFLKHT